MARRKPQICKVDGNQAQLVEALRKMGFSVCSIAKVANGAPDLVVGLRGVNLLFEVKVPGERLNENEVKWHAGWKGQVAVVTCLDDVLAAFAEVRRAA